MYNHQSINDRLCNYAIILIMLFVLIVTLFPYLNVLAKALNEGKDSMLGGITIYPRKPTLENIKTILGDPGIFRSLILSISIVILGTLTGLLVQFAAAYALKKKTLLGRSFFLTFLIIPMFFNGGLIPRYLLYSKTGLLNNYLVYILPTAFSFYNMIVIRTYMQTSIPVSLEESAKLDGANDVTIFFRIVLPLSKPVLATIALWIAVAKWNDWITTLYFVTRRNLHTLQYKLMLIIRESERLTEMIQKAIEQGENVANIKESISVTPEALIAAQVIVTTIPIIMVYPFLQGYFVKGVMLGAIKE